MSDPVLSPTIAGQAMSASLKAVTDAHSAFHAMFLRGYGVTFFALGFVTGVAAVSLRIDFTEDVTMGTFFGLLGGALLLIVLSFVFFLFDLRATEAALRSANEQSEEVTRALIAKQGALDAQAQELTQAQRRAGVA
jgi:hypothetical protein